MTDRQSRDAIALSTFWTEIRIAISLRAGILARINFEP
jgi:hypothetical protein